MIKVDNKKAIKKLANNSFNANKLRNIFAIAAIVLTTVMFTTLFTVGMSMKASLEESTMRQTGGKAHGSFKYLTQEQYDRLKGHKLSSNMEYSIVLGIAENEALRKHPSEIRYGTEGQAEFNFAKPTEGRMPEKFNEVAMDTIVLDYLGLPYELGQEIELEYMLGQELIKDKFILSGYWEGDKVIPASQIWISREYIDSKLEGYESAGENDPVGRIFADVMFKNSLNIENRMAQILVESGYGVNEIDFGINWAYMGNSGKVDMSAILAVIGGLLLIIFCGYLIIYNIFFISVSRDIRFYGLLKTIGTTSKQIGRIIRKQSMTLSLIGIPMGLIIGYLIGVVITPMVLGQINIAGEIIAVNPIIFIGAGIFAVITVLISVRKPAKIAGKVSPIEALRNTEGKIRTKITAKKSQGGKLRRMAFANVFRSRKKAVLVTISLSLSLIILNCTYSMVKGFDMDTYLSKMIVSDFVIADAGYFNVNIGYTGQETMSEEVLNELADLNGISEIGNVRFVENMLKIDNTLKGNVDKILKTKSELYTEEYGQMVKDEMTSGLTLPHTYGIDETIMNQLKVFEGKMDYEKLKTGNYIIVTPFNVENGEGRFYNLGEKVTIDYGNGNTKEYEVMAIAVIPHNLSVRHSHLFDLDFYVSAEEFEAQMGFEAPMVTMMNVEEDKEADIEQYLKNYCESINKDMNYESKSTFVEEFSSMQRTYMSVGTILSFIIAVIGIMNFINTMITSVISRKHELAMLQSIGMTKKQMNEMLIWEGLTYAGLTAGFVLTIGSLISYFGVSAFMGGIWFFKFNFTITPVLICLPILFALAVVVPVICYKIASKDSVVERLRAVE